MGCFSSNEVDDGRLPKNYPDYYVFSPSQNAAPANGFLFNSRTEIDKRMRGKRKEVTDYVTAHGKMVRSASVDADVLTFLTRGGELRKLRSRLYRRKFYVNPELTQLRYDGSKKYNPQEIAVSLDEVIEIRSGTNTDGFNSKAKSLKLEDDHCLSVIYRRKGSKSKKYLDLVAFDPTARDQWVECLKRLILGKKGVDIKKQHDIWVRNTFLAADKNNDKYLTFNEIWNLMKTLNVPIPKQNARQLFEVANTDRAKTSKRQEALDIDEFLAFYEKLARRPELEALIKKYGNGEQLTLSAEQLQKFMVDAQKESDFSLEQAKELIEHFEICPDTKKLGLMGSDGFRLLLVCDDLAIFKPQTGAVYQDMTKPLQHYFINSSHNTYLIKDQLRSPSSVEGYINTLLKGGRCVELDCWDGSDGEPVIYHGHTLTSKIKLKDVIDAVKAYAFEASEYPVILSIENHLSIDQQQVLAKHLKTILGDMLLDGAIPDDMKTLPSPDEMKRKILVKAKRAPPSANTDDAAGEVSEDDEAADIENDDVKKAVAEKGGKHKVKVCRSLSCIVNYIESKSFKSFEHSKTNGAFYHNSSLVESKAFNLADNKTAEFIDYNGRQLIRIYPGGLRTDSSNYNPQPMWNVGAQIVTLNFQTMKKHMHINLGRFRDNGGCGYVLKPPCLFDPSFNPHASKFKEKMKRTVRIKVICGSQLPKPTSGGKEMIDPYVKVQIYGVDIDNKKFKTSTVNNNGFNPAWNETFESVVHVPDLALVRFVVRDHDATSSSEFIAQSCLPFNCMDRGYRTVHLTDKLGQSIQPASLFVHIDITSDSETEL